MFENDLLKGKRILITGGGTGIGKNIGRRYLELGAELIICGRRLEKLQETKDEFERETSGKVTIHSCDVRDPEAIEAMMAPWGPRRERDMSSVMRSRRPSPFMSMMALVPISVTRQLSKVPSPTPQNDSLELA